MNLNEVCSVWAIRTFVPGAQNAEICFIDTEHDALTAEDGDVILDHIKTEAKKEGNLSSFSLILKRYASKFDQEALKPLALCTNANSAGNIAKNDSSIKCNPLDPYGLEMSLHALTIVHEDPSLIYERMSEILNGVLEQTRIWLRGEIEANRARIIENKVAVVDDLENFSAIGALYSRGVKAVVYRDHDNRTVIIKPGDVALQLNHPKIQELIDDAGETMSWYMMPNGMMYVHDPKDTPTMNVSTIPLDDLAVTISNLLK